MFRPLLWLGVEERSKYFRSCGLSSDERIESAREGGAGWRPGR